MDEIASAAEVYIALPGVSRSRQRTAGGADHIASFAWTSR